MPLLFADIEQAARNIAGAVQRTPCTHARTLSELTGAEIFVKFENLQFTASFKERGALNKLKSLSDAARQAGVVAASAGNHAQGVAYHGQRLGIPVTIVMPKHTPLTKVEHTRGHGAEIILDGADLTEASAASDRIADERSLTTVHPYDDDLIIAGQGTIGLEMMQDVPDLDEILVPVGGGGMISGIAIAAKGINPNIRITGVEADLYPTMQEALAGRPPPPGGPTVAEGIAVKQVGVRNIVYVREWVDGLVSVCETDIERAITLYLNVEKTVAEGAGAATLAAILADPDRFRGQKIGVVLSGGNIDPRILASVIMRQLVREGRIVRLRIELSDVPGQLANVAKIFGETDANIIEVHHQRTFSDVSAKGTDIDVVCELRDAEHTRDLIAALENCGYSVERLSGPLDL
jgi:threonine dehydratase